MVTIQVRGCNLICLGAFEEGIRDLLPTLLLRLVQ